MGFIFPYFSHIATFIATCCFLWPGAGFEAHDDVENHGTRQAAGL